ncbi:MAG: hypothetical protein QXI93_00345 [Candidatus Methanomethylicia archaeon]
MIKRSACEAFVFSINGGNFSERLSLNFKVLEHFYPLLIDVLSYKLTFKEDLVYAEINFYVYDFKFNCKYYFNCNFCLGLVINSIEPFTSPLPSMRGLKINVKIFGDDEIFNYPLNFTVSYSYNQYPLTIYPQVQYLQDQTYALIFVIPINIDVFTLNISDWRGVHINVKIKY